MPGAKNPGDLVAKIQAALTGLQKSMPSGSKLQIGGTAMAPAAIEAQLSGYLPTFTAPDKLRAQLHQAVVARRELEPEVRELLVTLRAALLALHKRGNPVLNQFGMGTGAPGKQSPETQVLAAAARMLTRKKRGTTGKKQAAAIQVVTKPVVTIGGAKSVAMPTVSAVPPAVETALAQAKAEAAKPSGDTDE